MTSRKTHGPRLRRLLGAGTMVACGAALLAGTASAAPFSAELTHRGLVTTQGATAGALVPTGLFRRPGEPMFVYKSGGRPVAGVWSNGPDAAVVRNGTSENAPVIGRIVPSWDRDALRITIEPAGGPAVRTDVFGRAGTGHDANLTRNISTRGDLEGTYRALLRSDENGTNGWLSVRIDPEGATRFEGDLPAGMNPALVAAAVQAIDSEVDSIHQDLSDVSPLHRE